MSKKEEVSLKVDDETGNVILKSPYNKQFVNDFKAIVPYSARAKEDGRGWDGENMRWIFTFDFKDQVQELVEKYFCKDHRIARLNRMRKR